VLIGIEQVSFRALAEEHEVGLKYPVQCSLVEVLCLRLGIETVGCLEQGDRLIEDELLENCHHGNNVRERKTVILVPGLEKAFDEKRGLVLQDVDVVNL